MPLVWKDLIDMAGEVTAGGSRLYVNNPPAKNDAVVVRHLTAAGMVSLARTHLPEFAFSGLGLNPHFGTPVNPFDDRTDRIPGGSSSGSAVALARALAPVSIGTDTSGSVRIPSALNGLVGHQTTPGRIDKSGVMTLSETLDTVGALAHNVEDCAILDRLLRGKCAEAPNRKAPVELPELQILVPENYVLEGADKDVAAHFESAIKLLERAGCKIVRQPLTVLDEITTLGETHGTLVAAEAHFIHADELNGAKQTLIDRHICHRLCRAGEMRAYDLLVILDTKKRLSEAAAELLAGGKLMLMPTTPVTALPIAPLLVDTDLFIASNKKMIHNTMVANFLGLCSLTLPAGVDRAGLPIGILACAEGGQDEALLATGAALEPLFAGIP